VKKLKAPLLKIATSILLISIILYKVDKPSLLKNFKLLDIRYIPFILFLLIANYVVSAIRWKKLLIYKNCETVSLSYLINLYFVGSFFNNFMPTSIGGDVFKVFKLGKRIHSKSNAFSATFMERFTGVVALVLISSASLIKLLGFGGVLLFAGFWVSAGMGFLSLKFLSIKVPKLAGIYASIIKYKHQPGVLVWAFVTSFIVQLLAIFTQYFVFKAVGVDLPLAYSLFVFPVITLASFFIPSLNGMGVQDALYMQLFEVVGVVAEVSLSVSILYHLFRLGVSLIGGVLYAVEKAD